MISGSFVSQRRLGVRCGWSIGYPPGGQRNLPVLVVLHGKGGNHASAFGNDLGLQYYLAQQVAAGKRPFAIASVDGGDSYWHHRRSGEDAGAMVTDELLPILHDHGLSTSRIGLLGWSMGGYGALLLAGRLGADRVSVCVAESPALWLHPGDTAPGAFDDPADYQANTVFGQQAPAGPDRGTGRLRPGRRLPAGRPALRAGIRAPAGGRFPARRAHPRLLAADGAGPARRSSPTTCSATVPSRPRERISLPRRAGDARCRAGSRPRTSRS